MQCDFSEFSYGYAAIREAEAELASIYKAAGAPVLPSLLAEEKLGWDAKLQFVEYALFLQFKRIEYVSRSHPASPTWPAVGAPHYRFAIDTDGHQQRALLNLEFSLAGGTDPGHVYYAAPAFHSQHDFDDAYSYGQVLERSHILPPSEFGLGSGKHYFVSDLNGGVQILSEPRRPERVLEWQSMTAQVRDRAAMSRDRSREREMTLGDLEGLLDTSVRQLERDVSRPMDAPIGRRLQRGAAILGCGLILLVIDEESRDNA
jgi:hypothetical protein